MKRLRWFTVCAAALSTATALGQLVPPPDINLFGDDIPLKASELQQANAGEPFIQHLNKAKEQVSFKQLLVFRDGRRLHGELMEINGNEVVWRRGDTSEPLRFSRNEVRQVTLTANPQAGVMNPRFAGIPGVPPLPGQDSSGKDDAAHKSPSIPATMKLPGGDWLFGDVSSPDGEKFALQLTDGTRVEVDRSRLEWLHLAPQPAPAFGYFGSSVELESWLRGSNSAEVKAGTVSLRAGDWIGRAIVPPQKFEVDIEVPEDAENGTRVWLQPFGPQINCYTTGTVEIQLGRGEIVRQLFLNQFDRQTTKLPKEATAEKGPAKYRLLYDGGTHRIVVLRNGRQVGDWKFEPKKDDNNNNNVEEMLRQSHVNSICFDRLNNGNNGQLKFNRLNVQPWNGVLPEAGEKEETRDQLTMADGKPIWGKLGAIGNKQITFSGETKRPKDGSFLQFANEPAALADPVARVNLGEHGEFNVSKLEIREGSVHCDTSFATGLDVPMDDVQVVSFQDQPVAQKPSADMLVFKNGDELPGQALTANLSGGVRWKTASGQEVEFQAKRIAGVRLGVGPIPHSPAPGSTLELRDGQRFRGSLSGFDEKQVQFQHPQLGAVKLDRAQVRHLYPSTAREIYDGGRDPDGWMRTTTTESFFSAGGNVEKGRRAWIYLDGTYILRNPTSMGSTNSDEWDGLHREIPADMDRFEIRVEAAGMVSSSTSVLVRLKEVDNNLTWQGTVSYVDMNLVVYGRPQKAGAFVRPNWRDIPLQEKLPDLDARRAIRIFVDTKKGTSDVFINGVLMARTGQTAGERLDPGKYSVSFQPYPNEGGCCVLSNLWIGPWSGELPRSLTAGEAMTSLNNGDAAPGVPKGLHDGKLSIDGDLGPMEIALDKIQEVDFGGNMSAERTAGRLRFTDGTVVNVDRCEWDGRNISAHSATLGDLRLPAGAVNEIIFDPPPLRAPAIFDPKATPTKKENAAAVFKAGDKL